MKGILLVSGATLIAVYAERWELGLGVLFLGLAVLLAISEAKS